ncbi:hypothetical protein EDD15DRAFT_2368779 [Pisolithus albus]|nr:hypothetical protein EDD15DRAFT_2368779 [Pisolithus albus]
MPADDYKLLIRAQPLTAIIALHQPMSANPQPMSVYLRTHPPASVSIGDRRSRPGLNMYCEYHTEDKKRMYMNMLSGDWAWKQVDLIAKDLQTHGSMLVPIILGSDKTTVSVATGQNEYYPLYTSTGHIHNNVCHAHHNGVALIAFLAIPKTDRKHADDPCYHKFCCQLFHSSLSRILQSFKPGMTTPEVVQCSDGHFWRAIFELGPYITDYLEQALLACIVQGWCPWYILVECTADHKHLDDGGGRCEHEHTEVLVQQLELGDLWEFYGLVGDLVPFMNDFPRADIHQLLAPDILHQLIKGTFKDHLVTWVEDYLLLENSKALMKIYLAAIIGHVPRDMVRAIRAFIEFCYLAWQHVHAEDMILEMKDALARFHHYRIAFQNHAMLEMVQKLRDKVNDEDDDDDIKAPKDPHEDESENTTNHECQKKRKETEDDGAVDGVRCHAPKVFGDVSMDSEAE